MDEEAAIEGRQGRKSPLVSAKSWDGGARPWESINPPRMESRTDPRTGRDAYEMGSFETKPLPTSPVGVHRKESGGGRKW